MPPPLSESLPTPVSPGLDPSTGTGSVQPAKKGLTALQTNDGAVANPHSILCFGFTVWTFWTSDLIFNLSHPATVTNASLSETKASCTLLTYLYRFSAVYGLSI